MHVKGGVGLDDVRLCDQTDPINVRGTRHRLNSEPQKTAKRGQKWIVLKKKLYLEISSVFANTQPEGGCDSLKENAGIKNIAMTGGKDPATNKRKGKT